MLFAGPRPPEVDIREMLPTDLELRPARIAADRLAVVEGASSALMPSETILGQKIGCRRNWKGFAGSPCTFQS